MAKKQTNDIGQIFQEPAFSVVNIKYCLKIDVIIVWPRSEKADAELLALAIVLEGVIPVFTSRGSALQKRLRDREKEMEADERDRKREKEELEEIRQKLLDEGHPNPDAELRRVCLSVWRRLCICVRASALALYISIE